MNKQTIKVDANKNQKIFNLVNIGMAITSPSHEWIKVNDKLCDMFGYTENEFYIKKWSDMTHPDDLPLDLKYFQLVLSGKINGYEMDKRFYSKNGDIVFTHLTLSCERKADYSVDYLIASIQDITKLKNTEKELQSYYKNLEELVAERNIKLKESEEKFRTLAVTTPTAVMIFQNRKWIYSNPEGVKISGYSEDELYSMNFWDIVHPKYLKYIKKIGQKKVSGVNKIMNHELKIITKTEEEKWINLSGAETEFLGKPAGIISAIDITNKKNTEETLKNSESELRSLFNAIPDLIFEVNKKGKFLSIAPTQNLELYKPKKDVIGKTLWEIFPKETADNFYTYIKKCFKKQKLIKFEYTLQMEETEKWYEGRLLPKSKKSLLFVARNIDKRKQSEKRNKHLNKVLHAIRNVNQLITKEKNKEILIQKACKILIDSRGYTSAWIGLIDENNKFRDFAEAGIGKSFEYLMKCLKKPNSVECVKRALKQSQVVVIENKENVCKKCKMLGKVSGEKKLTVRLCYGNKIFGILSVSLSLELVTDNEEQSLLLELANDIAFELHNIDIEKQRDLATESLHESEEQFKTLAESSPTGILLFREQNFLYANPASATIAGYDEKELLSMSFWDIVHPDHRKLVKSRGLDRLKGMNPEKHYEIKIISKSGNTKWVDLTSDSTLFKGKIAGIVSVIDITERKRSEQIQEILNKITNAVITTDDLDEFLYFIKNQLSKIIDTTNFFVALYDEKTDTIMLPFMVDQKDKFTSFPAGKTLTSYVIKTKNPLLATKNVLKELEQSGEIKTFGSNSKIWLGVPLKTKGKIIGVLVVQNYENENAYNKNDMDILEIISHQISISIERKKAEQDLKKALAQSKESDRLKSVFLSTMSHELRTPLNAVIGFSELIDSFTPIEDVVDYVKTINFSGNHLLGIVEDVFNISLIESGEMKFVRKNHKILPLMEEIHEIMKAEREKINKQDIEIYLNPFVTKENLLVYTDSIKLKQILINLIKNSLKFTEDGYIEYGYTFEKNPKGAQTLKFYVKDTGIGINKDKQKIIFDIFRQADDSHTRKHDGAGIGLSISKKLTELLGGNIWFESIEGKGTTFYFTMPFNIVDDNPKKQKENNFKQNATKLKNATILIAEDDSSSFFYLESIFKNIGINIIRAHNGKEAVRICLSNPDINLVLMDIQMPEMDGYEATKQIKKNNFDLPIIAQTAFTKLNNKNQSVDAGCNDFIKKPIDKNLLFEKLAKQLN